MKKFSTHTENIGLGGVCVVLSQQLDRFSEVEVILFLEDKKPPVYCDGRIVWTVKRTTLTPKGDVQIDTGVEFVNLKEKDKLRIEKVVQECLRKQSSQSNS